MQFLASICGWLLFIGLCINFAANCGERWKIGPLGMPETLVGPDGLHYLDGAAIDPITLAVHNSGFEQQAGWTICGVLVLLLLFLASHIVKLRRMMREFHELAGKFPHLP
jgi:hypothetical protein